MAQGKRARAGRSAEEGDPRQRLGLRSERRAEAHLRTLGWTILDRRWRCRLGELDLVALEGETVVFVEVRSRSGTRHGRPEETVGALKQARVAALAQAWLATRGRGHPPACRFDVVAVDPSQSGPAALRHYRDAFRAR